MRTISNRALAKALGVSETAVRRAQASGRIRREPDGSWELANVRVAWQHNTDAAQQRPAARKPVPEAALGSVRETLREQGLPSTDGATFLQARTANEVLKAQERRLRIQRLRGEVVDRAMAQAQVFRLAREERDAWLSWPARVAAIIAGELGCGAHQVQAALDHHVREHLLELAEPRLDLG